MYSGHRFQQITFKLLEAFRLSRQSHIIAAGYTQKEAVEACSAEYGWSDSDSNFSAKLSDQTLRYREVLELADVLGYEIVWQKRRDD